MPLKINVSTARKLGTANYSSIAASCAVEFEADAGLLGSDSDGFHRRVVQAYSACRAAVEAELARQQGSANGAPGNGSANGVPVQAPYPNGSGDSGALANGSRANGNGQAGGHAATEKQMVFARQLARAVPGLGLRRLETLAEKMFAKPLAALSSMDASALIDTLKALKAGEIDLAAVLQEGGT